MLYLLDANILINAERDYYPIEQVPEFWDWLLHYASEGQVKQPAEILEEVLKGGKNPDKDPLLAWLKADGVQEALRLDEEVIQIHVQRVVYEGYGPDLTDTELEEVGLDPILIAYALASPAERIIVTAENFKTKNATAKSARAGCMQ